jgi:toxin ParE1/3/4
MLHSGNFRFGFALAWRAGECWVMCCDGGDLWVVDFGVRYSRRAEVDLYELGVYTFRTWGETDHYIRKMEECCQFLAGNPGLGRPWDEICPGLRRMEQGKHVVLYREEPGGILVSRIRHQRMLPENRVLDGEDDTR